MCVIPNYPSYNSVVITILPSKACYYADWQATVSNRSAYTDRSVVEGGHIDPHAAQHASIDSTLTEMRRLFIWLAHDKQITVSELHHVTPTAKPIHFANITSVSLCTDSRLDGVSRFCYLSSVESATSSTHLLVVWAEHLAYHKIIHSQHDHDHKQIHTYLYTGAAS